MSEFRSSRSIKVIEEHCCFYVGSFGFTGIQDVVSADRLYGIKVIAMPYGVVRL